MPSETLIVFPPFRLDVRNEQLWRDAELVPVRPKPFAVLAYLAAHPDRLVTAAELRKAVWPDTYVSEGLLRGYIREVRQVLGDDAETPRFVETVPRRGYRFLVTVSSGQQSVVSRTTGVSDQSSAISPSLTPPLSSQPTIDNWQLTTPLVGRSTELAQLYTWLGKALQGTRQVVFVLGEPGIGKTTLSDAFLGSLASSVRSQNPSGIGGSKSASPFTPHPPIPAPWLARGQCIEHYGAGEAYLPVLEALGQLCRQPGGEQVVMLLSRYAPTWLVQMPALVSDTEFEALQRKAQGATRERMLREMAEAIEALTAERPLVLVIEDVHWSDHSTLDLLSLLAQRRGPARLFLLATYRPADVVVSRHPLKALKQELQVHGRCEELPLGFLTTVEVNQYLAARFPQQQFPSALGRIIHESTEGNPLFMVNVVDEWVRQKVLRETDGQWQLAAEIPDLASGVPESLRQMIERQLERLTPEEQRMLEAASVVGSEFTTATVAAVVEEQLEHVEAGCEGLAKREQFLRARGMETLEDGRVAGRYAFLHALFQQVLYERLAPMRCISLHQCIGDWEERAFGTRVGEHATELAMHFERGRDYPRAVHYLGQAAENAMRRNAYQEAIALLNGALGTLKFLPDTPERTQQELALHIALGVPLLMTKGYAAPEIEQTYARAHEICQQLGAHPQHLPALAGLFRFHLVRSELTTARALGEQVMHLAQGSADPLFRAAAHSMLGVTLAWLGEFPVAREHLEQGQHLYDPQQHRYVALLYGDDTGVVCHAYGASILWYLGYPDQARVSMQAALALAREVSIPHIVAFALDSAAWLHLHCREEDTTWEYLAMLEALASKQGFQHWVAASTILRGRRLVQQRQEGEGIALMRQGLAAYRATGAELGRAQYLALLVEAYGQIGQTQKGLTLLTEALTAIHKTGERHCEAELYRLQGALTLQQARASRQHVPGKSTTRRKKVSAVSEQWPISGPHADAEACFLKAIEIARNQQAKSLELRAATNLSRLWQQEGKQKEAHRMLSEVYDWFTEGFDTKDLQEAKALLNALAEGQ